MFENRSLRKTFIVGLGWLIVGGGPSSPPARAAAREMFRDAAPASGLDFVHFNGMAGAWHFPEINGAGVALLDYDGDGDLDVFLVQGAELDGRAPEGGREGDRLFRNDLEVAADGTRVLRFTDVTEDSGLDSRGYGMGVATGDFDNDGRTDLYVTRFGHNQMWRNQGPGPGGVVTFADVTAAWGVGEERWSIAAAAVDVDADDWLDLYVGNYLKIDLGREKVCRTAAGTRDYCHPGNYEPEPDVLWRNRGGRFEDVSAAALPGRGAWPTLGVVAADVDGDGRLDLYVANDEKPNQLWLNQGPDAQGRPRFREDAQLSGCAVNEEGRSEASMGVAAGDVDGDGDEDLFMTHLTQETNTLFRNAGGGLFHDGTGEAGLGPPSWPFTGFGTVFLDVDNDGRLDLLTVNGAVGVIEELRRSGDAFPFHQTNQLFRNLGGGRFTEITAEAGEVFALSEVSRGAAAGDVDNDGDTDVVVTANGGPVRLLVDQVGQERHWLGLRLLGRGVDRDMLGARAVLVREGSPPLVRRARTDGSYASAGDPRVLFGLGGDPATGRVEVTWPDGTSEAWEGLPPDRYSTLRQGSGRRRAP